MDNDFRENIILVDTSALIGIFNSSDQHHSEAEEIYKKLKDTGKNF